MGDDAASTARWRRTPLEVLTAPVLERLGTLTTIGNLPRIVRQRFDLPSTPGDQARLDRLAQVYRLAFEAMPRPLNRATFEHALRLTDSRTRSQRYVPSGSAA